MEPEANLPDSLSGPMPMPLEARDESHSDNVFPDANAQAFYGNTGNYCKRPTLDYDRSPVESPLISRPITELAFQSRRTRPSFSSPHHR